ncbi:MAG: hypothetical protein JW966_05905 [Anaerolineae bacterium]|nr:hypothetical protein [Anaerolineae bacterium]
MTGRIRKQGVVAALLLVLLISMFAVPAGSQAAPLAQNTGGKVTFFNSVTGALDATTPAITFTFDLLENTIFSVSTWNRSDNLAVDIAVYGPGGEPMGEAFAVDDSSLVTGVEAVLAPVTGEYSATVTRAGDTSGEFGLFLLPGYSFWDKWDIFEGEADDLSLTWDPSVAQYSSSALENGTMVIEVFEQDTLSFIQPSDDLTWSDIYIQADIQIQGSPTYFEYGFLLGMQPDVQEFYAITFSSEGDWSLSYYSGEWTTIQPWTKSPLVDPANITPTVGILLHDHTFRAYIDNQFVGEITDADAHPTEGSIALVGATTREQTDTLTLAYDNLIITAPSELDSVASAIEGETGGGMVSAGGDEGEEGAAGGLDVSGLFGGASPTPTRGLPFGASADEGADQQKPTATKVPPTKAPSATPVPPTPTKKPTVAPPPTPDPSLTTWQNGSPQTVVGELQQKGVVPAGGRSSLTVPSSYADASGSGFYPLGQGRNFRNFVLGFNVRLDISGPESACGMHFRDNPGSRSVALVTLDGSVFLGQFNNEVLHDSSLFYSSPAVLPGEGSTNNVIVTAIEDQMRMYVNGEFVAAGSFQAESGGIALQLLVVADDTGATQRHYCQLTDIWVWEF